MTTYAILSADPECMELALGEACERVPGIETTARLGDGVCLVAVPGGFPALSQACVSDVPVFVRHLAPVDVIVKSQSAAATVIDECVALAVTLCEKRLDRARTFSVQTRVFDRAQFQPFTMNNRIAEALCSTGATLDVRDPQQVLSVAIAPDAVYVGFSPVASNLSNWAGGMRRFAREPGQISRAEFKLLEALDVFGVQLLSGGRALDLGAAPGGWTRVLRSKGLDVVAVDPAALHESLYGAPGVTHVRDTAENYLRRTPPRFDCIVNDMRQDARDSARTMAAYASFLSDSGVAIMTIKLAHFRKKTAIEQARVILERAYKVLGIRHLFHNRSEVTVLLGRK